MRSARPASAAGPFPICSGPSSSRLAAPGVKPHFAAGNQGLTKRTASGHAAIEGTSIPDLSTPQPQYSPIPSREKSDYQFTITSDIYIWSEKN